MNESYRFSDNGTPLPVLPAPQPPKPTTWDTTAGRAALAGYLAVLNDGERVVGSPRLLSRVSRLLGETL